MRVPAGCYGNVFSFAVACARRLPFIPSSTVGGPHVWSGASRQTNLAKAQALRDKSTVDTWDRPLSAVTNSATAGKSQLYAGTGSGRRVRRAERPTSWTSKNQPCLVEAGRSCTNVEAVCPNKHAEDADTVKK